MSPASGYVPPLMTFPTNMNLPAVDRLDDDGGIRFRHQLHRRFLDRGFQLIRRQTSRLKIVQKRDRDLAVRPHDGVGRHVLLSPHHDR